MRHINRTCLITIKFSTNENVAPKRERRLQTLPFRKVTTPNFTNRKDYKIKAKQHNSTKSMLLTIKNIKFYVVVTL